MRYSTCRINLIFAIFTAVMTISAATCPIIASDQNTTPTSDVIRQKITLSKLPEPESYISNDGPVIKAPSDDTQASFINLDKNLPVSFLPNPKQNNYVLKATLSYTQNTVQGKETESSWTKSLKNRYKNGIITTLTKGAKHITLRKYIGSRIQNINVLEINRNLNPNLMVKPALAADTLLHTSRVSTIVKKNKAIAGVNASFFKQSTGAPLGTMILDGELVTGPVYNRVTFGINDDGYTISKVNLSGNITTNNDTKISIDNINQPRMLSSYTLVYTNRWGKTAPISPKYGIQVAIENNKVIEISKNQLTIPATGYVIIGPQSKLNALKIGQDAKVNFYASPEWQNAKYAVGGGPYLIKNGEISINAKEEKFSSIGDTNPRTAVGYTKDNKLIIITVDGRQRRSGGLTLYSLAKLMKEFGCYNAMNFDGGSSTQMVIKNRVVNYPLNNGGSYVSNGLIVAVQ